MSPTLTTYSMWSAFRNCRKRYQWRYVEELVPLERNPNLRFGSLIHECLEFWHRWDNRANRLNRLRSIMDYIDAACIQRTHDRRTQADWHLALAMMTGYAETYPEEEFEVVDLEKKFEGPIINPVTRAQSRSFIMAGKVDGIVRQPDGRYFLLEHKTASNINGDYLERLWTDFQIRLYAWYVRETLDIPVAGIIYNILGKAKLQQGQGETELEFEARRDALIAKSKTGKSSAKRKMPESDADFQARLLEKYRQPGMFHRELIYVSDDQLAELQAEIWELSKALLEARRRNAYYQNTDLCSQFGTCAYFPLCRSGGNPLMIENQYERVKPHQELLEQPTPF